MTLDRLNTILISYDRYCNEPNKTIAAIIKKTGISSDVPNISPFNNRRKVNAEFSDDIYEAAMDIYNELNKRGNLS